MAVAATVDGAASGAAAVAAYYKKPFSSQKLASEAGAKGWPTRDASHKRTLLCISAEATHTHKHTHTH